MSAGGPINAYEIIKGATMTGTSVITSPVQEVRYEDNVGIQLIWTGTPVGSFDIQVSLNYNANTGVAGDWTSLTLSNPIAPAGSASTGYIDLNQLSAPYFRIVYTNASGTGVLNAWITAKGV